MPAAWVRVSPLVLTAAAPMKWRRKSGHMLMVVAAKKHLTIFYRKREAPGAGRAEVKEKFAEIAHKTLGEPLRSKRNALIREEMIKAAIGTGVYRRMSRARPGSPLYKTVYEVTVPYTPGVKVKPPTSFVVAAKKRE
ncbi:MAG: hypothetical protein QXK90_01175 [Candidatus Parvarchaeota archaeon]